MVDAKYIKNLQGKDFVLYEGLLDVAHQQGLVSIETEIIKLEDNMVVMKAVAKTSDKTFTGYGDADNSNVNKMIAKHKIRMAETRAKARALRDLTNIGMTAFEELGGDEDETPKRLSEPQVKRLFAIAKGKGIEPAAVKAKIMKEFDVKDVAELTKQQYDSIVRRIETAKAKE